MVIPLVLVKSTDMGAHINDKWNRKITILRYLSGSYPGLEAEKAVKENEKRWWISQLGGGKSLQPLPAVAAPPGEEEGPSGPPSRGGMPSLPPARAPHLKQSGRGGGPRLPGLVSCRGG